MLLWLNQFIAIANQYLSFIIMVVCIVVGLTIVIVNIREDMQEEDLKENEENEETSQEEIFEVLSTKLTILKGLMYAEKELRKDEDCKMQCTNYILDIREFEEALLRMSDFLNEPVEEEVIYEDEDYDR